jgi:hypothetical protein
MIMGMAVVAAMMTAFAMRATRITLWLFIIKRRMPTLGDVMVFVVVMVDLMIGMVMGVCRVPVLLNITSSILVKKTNFRGTCICH